MIGTMDRREIAERLGTSLANLKRAFRGTRLAYFNYCSRQPELVRAVNKYYETHSQAETAESFGLKPKQVDHIVNRYKTHKPKQIRWTDKEILEAAKMGGLISYEAQAKYFNRPRAHAGSIKALWTKRFNFLGGQINGMPHNQAKHLVDCSARYVYAVGTNRKGERTRGRRICLWLTMAESLKPEVPGFIASAIHTMADFQRWLWRDDNPKPRIMRMIKQRELT